MVKNYQLLKENFISLVQNSNLDIGGVYFVFKDLMKDIEMQYYAQINKEFMLEEKERQEKEQNDNKNSIESGD